MNAFRFGVLLLAVAAIHCGKSNPTSPTPTPAQPGSSTATLVGAGDIGLCGSPGAASTGRLVQDIPGEVFIAGDAAYPSGSAQDFRDCFDPYWGHARGRWHAVPGNHEYESPGAIPFFNYFAAAAGPAGLGYYYFTAGEWLVLMLNSEVPIGVGSPQYEFVRQLLEGRSSRCQIAIWHRPLFSSGPNGPNPGMRDMWRLLDQHQFDVVVNGHEHLYERFSRQDPDGRATDNGIRQFTVGTGGGELYNFVRLEPNSGARISDYGVIRFTLNPDSYDWQFVLSRGGIGDSGFTACR